MLALRSLAVLAATASLASAQLSGLTGGLSSQCQSAAASLLAGDFATCANVFGLVSVITASGSVVQPLGNWITSVCTSSPCSDSTVQSAASTVNNGCQTDLQNGVATALALRTITTDYPDVRNLLCLQSVSNSSYCVTDTLTNIQTANKTDITVDSVEALLGGGLANLVRSLNSVPTGAYCTDCGHAIFSEAGKIGQNASLSSSATSTAQSAAASKCGASFADGQIPSSVRIGGGSSASASSGSSGSPSASSANSGASSSLSGLSGTSVVGLAGMVGSIVAGAMVVFA